MTVYFDLLRVSGNLFLPHYNANSVYFSIYPVLEEDSLKLDASDEPGPAGVLRKINLNMLRFDRHL